MKLTGHKIIKGKIVCKSGLHIGGSTDEMQIAGVDLPIIKHPISGEPYIPGSSLKGKMRNELEHQEGKFGGRNDDEPCGCGREDCLVCRVFGPHKNVRHSLGPTRILVRDAYFSDTTREEYASIMREKGVSYIEKKTENVIDRKTGTAMHPRTLERVPAGAVFDMELTLRLFEMDAQGDALIEHVKEGLRLVEKSYLGASGSRGSGQVKFEDLTLDGESFDL